MIKVYNVTDSKKLFDTIDQCEKPVTLHNDTVKEDLRHNKIAHMFLTSTSEDGSIAQLKLDVSSPKDTARLLRFLMETDVA